MKQLQEIDRDRLEGMLEDFAKNWLAHDGLWFLEIEKHSGMDTAIDLDTGAWRKFTIIEARRIMQRHGIEQGSGLEGLKKALGFRMYAVLNRQEILNEKENSFEFRMIECRVQCARERKNLPLFPCKPVGIAEYEGFARTIDPRIATECVDCPPDEAAGKEHYCRWRFSIG